MIFKSEYGNSGNNFNIFRENNILNVELTYPNLAEEPGYENLCKYIEINQESVRSTPPVRLEYNYDRSGWVVLQPIKYGAFRREDGYLEFDFLEWVETNFIPDTYFDYEELEKQDPLFRKENGWE